MDDRTSDFSVSVFSSKNRKKKNILRYLAVDTMVCHSVSRKSYGNLLEKVDENIPQLLADEASVVQDTEGFNSLIGARLVRKQNP